MKRPSRGRAVTLGVVVAITLLILLWNWNWFRPLVEAQISAALGRRVRVAHFDAHLLRRYPDVMLEGIEIENPEGYPEDSRLARVQRLRLAIDPWVLWQRKLRLVEIDIDHPQADLRTADDGQPNWVFDKLETQGDASASAFAVEIGLLKIGAGQMHLLYPKLKADFELQIHTEDQADARLATLVATAEGKYSGQPITAHLRAGSLVSLRDAGTPYPVDFDLVNGHSHLHAKGTLQDAMKLAGADVRMRLEGADLADLYPLTAVPFPQTPAFRIEGQLDYAARAIRFHDFTGTVGSSDLNGMIAVTPPTKAHQDRPLVEANLTSKKVVLADLVGFIGAAPGKADATNQTVQQKKAKAAQAANPKLLPQTKISLPKLRGSDLDIHYKVGSIDSESTPIDNLVANLKVIDGHLTLTPLSFGVGSGSIVSNIDLDGTQDLVRVKADVDFRQLDLERMLHKSSPFKGGGKIGGQARLDARGNSVADLLGGGNGELKLFTAGGNLSALLVDLAGLDFGNGVLSAIGIPSTAQLRCMATDFELDQGQVNTKLFVFDTTEANVVGSGTANLRDETIDYKLATEPKHFNIGSIPAPILIRGPLKNPSILPDPVALAERGGAAIALGVVLTPLAALIPTIQLGLGKDTDCDALLASVQATVEQAKQGLPRAKASRRR